MGGIGKPDAFIVTGKRLDGRKLNELRPIEIKAGVIPNADGSATLTAGNTKVIAAVYGPREMFPKHLSKPDKAYLNVIYSMASFSTPERNRPGPSRRSTEISKVIKEALSPAIILEKYPKTKIDVYVEVTNANAGTRTAALSAAAVALADAGIEMRDLVSSVAVGKIDGELALDLFEIEDNFGEADLPVAIMPRTKEIVLWQMDGNLTKPEIKKLIDMAMKGCNKIYALQKKALKEKYKTEGELMIKSYLSALLQKNKREDGRGLFSYRDIQVEYNPIKRANGSARVRLGETDVLVGVKMDVGAPFPDSPEDGVLIVNTELSPLASPDFEPGPPRENAIEMARIIDRSIRESKTLDFEKLFIEKDKVWIVFIDVYPMNDAGNLYDAAVLGAIIALKNARFPKYDKKEEKVLYKEFTDKKLPINKLPILTTFAKLDNTIFVDPTSRELKAMDTRLSIATLEDGNVCAMQKGEVGTFTDKEILELVGKSAELGKKLRKYIK